MRVTPSFLSAALAGFAAFFVLPLIGTLPSSAAEEAATYAPRVRSGTIGRIERLSPALDTLLDRDARIEVLAEGFDWSEGPVWFAPGGYLLFSDVPRNVVWRWRENDGLLEYLRPSGYTAAEIVPNTSGSNGLTLDNDGRLILCQHGDRQVARLKGRNRFEPLATNFEGKRFNSPNDIAIRSNGELYFTDPPYGLPKGADDPARELPFQGVFRISQRGRVTLLVRDLTRPNGIAFSPDGRIAYVANSDPARALWMAYDVAEDGSFSNGRVFFDATDKTSSGKGLPDGLKVHTSGALFATGPGGVYVFAPDGRQLGLLRTGEATANCAFNADQRVLYLTADMYLMRVRMK